MVLFNIRSYLQGTKKRRCAPGTVTTAHRHTSPITMKIPSRGYSGGYCKAISNLYMLVCIKLLFLIDLYQSNTSCYNKNAGSFTIRLPFNLLAASQVLLVFLGCACVWVLSPFGVSAAVMFFFCSFSIILCF